MTTELWKPVLDYEGLYEVSDKGRVRSACTRPHSPKGYVRKLNVADGYCKVILLKSNRRETRSVHRLVLEVFVGPCPIDMKARHLNDIKTDNRPENLRWGTHRENCADAKRNKIVFGPEKGYKHSEEARRKMSISRLRYLSTKVLTNV